MERWLIDATHNNAYGTYVAAGLNAAIAVAGITGCASPSTVGDARLTLSKRQAPAGDDPLARHRS